MARPDWIGSYEGDPDYEFDVLALEIGEQIVERMEELGLTQAGLARKMGVSRARISQILRGDDNLTLKSVVAVAIGLDCRVGMRLKPERTGTRPNRRDCRPVDTGSPSGVRGVLDAPALLPLAA